MCKKPPLLSGCGKPSLFQKFLCPLWGQLDCLLKQQPNFYGVKLFKTNKCKLSVFKVR